MTGLRQDAVPAVASTAVRGLVTGPRRRLTVLAGFPAAVYLHGDQDEPPVALALVTSDGVHHPNALVLARDARERPFARLHPGSSVEVGRGSLRLPTAAVRVTRWWDPRPALAHTAADALAAHAARVAAHVRGAAPALAPELADPLVRLLAAVGHLDAPAAADAARALVGRGPGLTPTGDDLLAALFAGVSLLAPAVASPAAQCRADVLAAVADGVVAHARDATTAVSAALLHHAVRGRVCRPAADVLTSLTAGTDPDPATDALLRIGASSGRDLALGILAAVDAVSAADPVPDHAVPRAHRVPSTPPRPHPAALRSC